VKSRRWLGEEEDGSVKKRKKRKKKMMNVGLVAER
jgi:hypothetical protein